MSAALLEHSCSVAGLDRTQEEHRITCYQWGSPSNSPLLCVHGLTRNGRDFDHLARDLCERYFVICPDMPGRGKSDYLTDPAGYNYPSYVASVAALLKEKNITSLDWIGTSMGGIIAMMFANAFPGMIKRLVLNDIGTVVPAGGLKRILSSASTQKHFKTFEEAEAAFRERLHTFGIEDESDWQHLLTYGIQENDDNSYSFSYDNALLSTLPTAETVEDISLSELWPALRDIPILLIRGAESDVLTRENALQMKDTHPNLTLHELPGVGHAPTLMTPEQISLIKEWLH